EGKSGSEVQVRNVQFGIMPPTGFFTQFNIASIILSPNFGAKGSTVTVKGQGFPTTIGTVINGYRFGPVEKTFTTPVSVATDGTFTAVITVPTEASLTQGGRYPVEFRSSPTERFSMSEFQVISTSGSFILAASPTFLPPVEQGGTATLSISITSLNQATPTVTVSVRGLPPKITSSVNGSSTAAVTLSKGDTKSLPLTITVDQFAPPGPYPFEIRGVSGSEEVVIPIMFGIMPKISLFGLANILLSPDVGGRGTTVTISGQGFSTVANTKINSVQLGPRTITFTTPVDVTSGAFTAVISIPSDMPFGFHPLTVADTQGRQDTKPFNVIPGSLSEAGTSGLAFAFTLTASPPFIGPVVQGGTGTTKISIQSLNNQNPTVQLRVDGVPPGVTASFDGAGSTVTVTVPPGQTVSKELTLTVGSTTPPGPYGLSITGQNGTQIFNLPLGFGIMPNIGGGIGFASIVANPDSGRPGDQVTISGAGFQSGQSVTILVKPPGAPIEITLSSSQITVQSDGTWSFTGQIPSNTQPGFYELIARAGGREARSPMNIIHGSTGGFFVKLSPDFLRVNQGSSANTTLTVKSSNSFTTSLFFGVEGLPPGITVKFIKEDQTIVSQFTGSGFGNNLITTPTPVTPPSGGVLKITVNVAASSFTFAGAYPIFIRIDRIGAPGEGRPLGIAVLPTGGNSITLTPPSGSTGTGVSVSGVGFGATETISIKFAGSTVTTVPTTITTGSDGTFSAAVTIPSGFIPGLYPISATGATSGKSSTAPFSLFPSLSTFNFFVSPPQIAIPKGGSGNFTLTIQPYGIFNSTVTLSVAGLLSGASTAFSPSSSVALTVGTPTTVALKVTIPSNAQTGASFFSITASGGGTTQPFPASIRVTPIASEQDFDLILGPPGVVIPQGGNANVSIIIRSFNGFSSAVTLSTTSTTAGLTRTLGASSIIPTATGIASTSVLVTASGSLQLGRYQVTVTGTSGATVRQTVLQVGIMPSGITIQQFNPPPVLPQQITPLTPLPIEPPWGDKININSMITDVSQSTQIIPRNIPRSPSNLSALPTGSSDALGRVTSIEPSVNVTKVNALLSFPYDLTRLGQLGLTPSNLRVAFLADNGTWVRVTTTLNTSTGTVSANITHFSSWTVLGSPPSFSASASPSTLSITQGKSDTSTITLTSLNTFNSAITLTVTGAPSGVTTSFSPSSSTSKPQPLPQEHPPQHQTSASHPAKQPYPQSSPPLSSH
ncbi:MAG: hypothetical protein HYU39_05740, partial [Thaumarchaeota archaeon]|nr:hypothetical protein [Nitrososphaerota archaeon]